MSALSAGLRQPDARSCGAASVVMARLLHDAETPTAEDFDREVRACHRRLTSARLHGRPQPPWPRALGTPPWAVRRELEDLTGRPHRLGFARLEPAESFDRLAATGGALYVGSRLLPRHVLLVLPPRTSDPETSGPDPVDRIRCYQPSRGTVVELGRAAFSAGRLRGAGWPWPWFAITPVHA